MATRRGILLLSLLLFMFSFPGRAGAVTMEDLNQELDKQAPQITQLESAQPGDTVTGGLGMILSGLLRVVVVLVILLLLAWALGRIFQRRFTGTRTGKWLKVVDEVTLGNNRSVVLCRLENQVFALGVTEQQVNYLFPVEDEDLLRFMEQENLLAELAEADKASPGIGFKQRFSRALSGSGPERFRTLLQDNLTRGKQPPIIDKREENNHDADKP
jgi:flagellar biogenesis protein FliO